MSTRSSTPFGLFKLTETGLYLRDNTISNASTSRHGLLPKLDGNSAHYLDGTGAWSTPAGGGGGGTFCGVRVRNSTNITLTSGVSAALTFDTESYDTDTFHDTSSNTSRLTVPSGKAGKYAISGSVEWASNTTGIRALYLKVNNTTFIRAETTQAVTVGATPTGNGIYAEYSLSVGDYVEMLALQTSGGNLNVTASSDYTPTLQMHLIGA